MDRSLRGGTASVNGLEHNLQPAALSFGTSVSAVGSGQNSTVAIAPTSQLSATTSTSSTPSLWEVALEELSPQNRATLVSLGVESGMKDIKSNLESIRSDMERMLYRNRDKPWQFTFRGENIVMRDVGRKILEWVNKFKEIGDIIVQYDPGHIALPWAGFRFLLKVNFRRNPCN